MTDASHRPTILLVDHEQRSLDELIEKIGSPKRTRSTMRKVSDSCDIVGILIEAQPRETVFERAFEKIDNCQNKDMILVDLSFDDENRESASVQYGRELALRLRDHYGPHVAVGVYSKYDLSPRDRALLSSDGFALLLEEIRKMYDGSRRLTGDDWYDLFQEVISKKAQPEELVTYKMERGDRIAIVSDPRIVFVIHGRNEKARDSLFQFLRAIDLRPLEWSEAVRNTSKPSPYIGEVLDKALDKAQALIVLMTPDDEARLREGLRTPGDPPYESSLVGQARPNVIFEAGMAMGRYPDRTVIVELGRLRPFSDIGGRHVIRLSNNSQSRQQLAQRLETAKCSVNLTGTDWHTAGDFDCVN